MSDIHRGFMTFAFVLLALLMLHARLATTLSDDGIALVAFKNAVKFGSSLKVFSNWNRNDSNPCSWSGITCSPDFRVTALNITGDFLDTCGEGILDRGTWEQQSNLGAAGGSSFSCSQNESSACILGGTLSPEVGNLTELRALILPFNGLEGNIPKELGSLRQLEVLELQHNKLSGDIPMELGNLSNLRVLNLEGNDLENRIPQSLGRCENLVQLNLGRNKLSEGIPAALGNLRSLRRLSLFSNQLNKQVPPELERSCGTLEQLDLGRNFFIGSIPSWLGNCSKLQVLVLKSNYFRGIIPPELGRLTMLQFLDISMNRLTGQVPASIGNCGRLSFLVLTNPPGCFPPYTCSSKTFFEDTREKAASEYFRDKVEFNKFPGPLPESITALAGLEVLWAAGASFSGAIPATWGAKLKSLNLAQNSLSGDFPEALGSCQSLRYLDLSSNLLQGRLPAQLPASCMVLLNVSRNGLSGEIPARSDIKCNPLWRPSSDMLSSVMCPRIALSSTPDDVNLLAASADPIVHDLSSNKFSGAVPEPLAGGFLMQRQVSYVLSLSDNHLSGNISATLGSCERFSAYSVNVSHNSIGGEISGQDISRCSSLVDFDASFNVISGSLPAEVGALQNLTALDLSHNQLQGQLRPELGKLQRLQILVLANNSLEGKIPDELGQASSLDRLDLSGNAIAGEIPKGLGNLTNLQFLLLNNNSLSGKIPEALTGILGLTVVDLAFNNLSGAIPSTGSWADLCNNASFQGNKFLESCTILSPSPAYMEQMRNPAPAPSDLTSSEPDASPRTGRGVIIIVAITSGCAIAIVLFVLGLLVQCTRQRIPSRQPRRSGGRKEVITFTPINFELTYENVVRATGQFGVDFLIGNGGFGATYKAELTPGLVVAVKKLAAGRFQGVQQFDTEIRTLGRIQHPNLVTLIGYHASEAEMFLIYNYFPRGNLDSFIHNRSRGEITWQVVHRIALGIAEALAYLHDECVPRVLHRDIKPSNILLDNTLTAYLADFGLARLLGASETHATTDVAGTFGYVAPEYAMTCRVSDKADVYSYGVVLLELLSGKRALDPAFSDFGHGFNIVAWACSLIGQGRASEVFIADLWSMGPEAQLLETLKLAVMCTVDSLTIRPTMKQVVDRLKHMHDLRQR